MWLALGSTAGAGQVVINEIMFHPNSEQTAHEWIELHNRGTNAVNLSGWRFADGVEFMFPTNTVLPAGGYVVVAANTGAFAALYPLVTNVLGNWVGQLSNSGEEIELLNATGGVEASVRYADAGDWAIRQRQPSDRNTRGWDWLSQADGAGSSLELVNPALPNDAAPNWVSSPTFFGTPGRRNSAFSTNAAPLILDVAHTPPVPRSSDAVVVTARVLDESATGFGVTLWTRDVTTTNPPPFATAPMFDDGAHGDGPPGDGVFGAILPARTNRTIIEFYVQASDGPNTRAWPGPALSAVDQGATPLGQVVNALYQVDDEPTTAETPFVRLVMTAAERQRLATVNNQSDAQMHATMIVRDGDETDVRHSVGVRIRGAGSRGAAVKNHRVNIPSDRPWHGLTAINLNSLYVHAQLVGSVVAQKSGLPAANARMTQVRFNGVNLARSDVPQRNNGSGFGSYVIVEPINNEWAARHSPTDPDGNVYRASSSPHLADLSYQGTDLNTYIGRGYSKTSNASENDWSDLIGLTYALSPNTPDSNFVAQVSARANVREWMTYFAVFALTEYTETSLGSGEGDDYALYRGIADPRFQLIGHDFDTIFNEGDTAGNVNRSIWIAADTADQADVARFLQFPAFAPLYYEELHRLATTVFSGPQLNPLFDQFLGSFVPGTIIASMKGFASNRVNAVLAQIPMSLRITNTLAISNGFARATTPTIALTGAANAIRTRSVQVNGIAANWIAWQAAWSVPAVPLNPGLNRLVVRALDGNGAEVERAYLDVWYDTGANTPAGGSLAANTTWTAANSPYFVNSTVTVPNGVTLTIQPGATVFFASGAGLNITGTGRLLAEGTEGQRIRFTRSVAATNGDWAGIAFNNTTTESRLAFADLEFSSGAGESLRANNAIVDFDSLTLSNTTAGHVLLNSSSFRIRRCVFSSLADGDLIQGNGLPPAGHGILQSNWFGTTTGLNDIVQFTGGQAPNAVLQVLDNTFTGASDDILQLNGADAYIEGNIFLRARPAVPGGDTAAAIVGDLDGATRSELTIVRNVFLDCDHAVLVSDGSRCVLVNNTLVGMGVAAVSFGEPALGRAGGFGATLDGNIIWHTPALFAHYTSGVMNVTVNRSVLPTGFPGTGNIVADPLLVNTNLASITATNIRDAFRLRAASPALGTGPNGLDMGALVRAGASISGEPDSPTPSRSALLNIGGPGIVAYRFRTNNGPWSAEQPIGNPLVLVSLVDGVTYTVSAVGKNSAGVWQDTNSPTVSRSWTINTSLVRVRINEVLAQNQSAYLLNGGYPDVVELLNVGAVTVNLSDWGVTDDPASKFKFRIPSGTLLGSGQYLLLQADDSTGGTNLHLGFGLDQSGDAVHLFNGAGQLMDSVVFGRQLTDLSIGVVGGQWTLTRPTLGAANVAQPLGDPRGLKINEWLADRQALYDTDFLEIWNPATAPVNLGGMFLSDEPLGWPQRHRITPLTFAGAAGFVVFQPDGRPEDGPAHLNFKLSRERGAISLADTGTNIVDCVFYGPQAPDISQGRQPDGSSFIGPFPTATPGAPNPVINPAFACIISASTQLITPTNYVWRYNQNGQDLGALWRAVAYDDSQWPTGAALFGLEPNATYPEPIRTPLNLQRPAGGGQVITYYFRSHFNVATNYAGWNVTVRAFVDDGAVFFLNGAEIGRIRMGGGAISYTNLAVNAPEPANDTFTFSGSSLVLGDNVMAVEVHQSTTTSSDIVFGMSMQAVLSVTNCSLLGLVLSEVMANNQSIAVPGTTNISDWIELFNPTTTNITLSGLSLTDNATNRTRWVFPPGLTIAPGTRRIVTFDSSLPPSMTAAATLNTGFGLGAGGDEVYLFNPPERGGALLDSLVFGVQPADFSIGRLPPLADRWGLTIPTPGSANLAAGLGNRAVLRFNEWLANPDSGDDFIEIYNPGAQPVELSDCTLTDDLRDPGKHTIVGLSFISAGTEGFVRFIADGNSAAGADHVNFNLSRDGESLGLFAPNGALIDAVNFGPQDNGVSEGRFPDGSTNITRFPGTATPGLPNVLPLLTVVVNEVLTHTDPPAEDAIELFNPTLTPVDISGWYLSDTAADPKRYRIPDGTVLEGSGYLTFYERQFNPNFDGRRPAFALSSSDGDQVYLHTADAEGNLTGFRTGVEFGAAENAVPFGRYRTSVGVDFTALSAQTFGGANAYPRVGPIVVSEIMYHPPDIGTNDNDLDEFIELHNASPVSVPLFDPAFPTNSWRLRDAVDFEFPGGVTLAPGDRIVVVGFDPVLDTVRRDAFRTRYSLSAAVLLFGPWRGKLGNDADNVELYKPDAPQPPTAPDANFVPYIQVDKVRYLDNAPWAVLADGDTNGLGNSLQRRIPLNYGNDPVNWRAAPPNPGAATGAAGLLPPSITALTPSRTVLVGANETLTVTVMGAAPLNYQWRFNGAVIAGATNASFSLANIQPSQEGAYSVLIVNPAGAASGTVNITVRVPPAIVQQPQSAFAVTGGTASFSVLATGSAPLSYQWRRNNVNIPGATGPALVITNAQTSDEANYSVVVTNLFGTVTSVNVPLTLNALPVILTQPVGTNLYTGDTAFFSVVAGGAAPLRYQWRFNGANIVNATNPTLTLADVQQTQAGGYSVRVTNIFGSAFSVSVGLTVLPRPFVTINATDDTAAEPGANIGRFTLARSGSTTAPLTVLLNIGGTATPGGDYFALPGSVTLAAGQSATNLPVVPRDDAVVEGPESIVLTLVPAQTYSNGVPDSATVSLIDNDNLPPSVVITNPVNGALYSVPALIPIGAIATDTGGTVVSVKFFADETNELAEILAPPFGFIWTNPPPGVHVLTALATDDLNASVFSDPVTITLNASPTVAITSPANGAAFNAPATFNLIASALDQDGAIVRVEFYQGANLIGTDTNAPYAVVLTNLPVGDYSFTARATDDRGAVTISTQSNVRVNIPSAGFSDSFAGRGVLTGFTNYVTGNSTTYTAEPGEPCHGGRCGDHSAWLTWTAPLSGPVTIDTFDSQLDTVLSVYTNSLSGPPAVTNLVLVAVNENADSFTLQSRVTFNAIAGRAYQIAVDAHRAGYGGPLVLHLSLPNPSPVILSHPQSALVNVGDNVTLFINATGAPPLTFQWRFNGADIPGAVQPSFTRTNIQFAHDGLYTAVVRNNSGSVTSIAAQITVRSAPVIIVQPTDTAVNPGGTAIFSVTAIGTAPLSYQWNFEGTPLSGETNPTLVRSNVQYTDAGAFTVSVFNPVGAAQSNPARLLVRPRLLGAPFFTNGNFRISYEGTPGQPQILERSTNLPQWFPLRTNTSLFINGQFDEPIRTAPGVNLYRLRLGP